MNCEVTPDGSATVRASENGPGSSENPNVSSVSSKWSRDLFTADEVLDAYEKGKEAGKVEEYEAKVAKFKDNLIRALNFSDGVFQKLKAILTQPAWGMKMRVDGFSSFSVIIVISKIDFVSPEIEKVYNLLHGEMEQFNTGNDIHWSFALMPHRGKLNEPALSSDGYTLKYADPTGV
jgi:hypothetical protein